MVEGGRFLGGVAATGKWLCSTNCTADLAAEVFRQVPRGFSDVDWAFT